MPIPLLEVLAALHYRTSRSRFRGMSMEEVFTDIYRTNHWGNKETVSGPGSSPEYMKEILENIRLLIADSDIKTVLDVPCGDFNWMRYLNFSQLKYIGGDIVNDLIVRNRALYQTENIKFLNLDLTNDYLPETDLIINRDCLVHFCFTDIQKAIRNVIESKSSFLLTTTFPKQTHNYDIVTGDWRPLNLQLSPFNFPEPLQMMTERVEVEFEKENKGKALGLWKIADLKINQ